MNTNQGRAGQNQSADGQDRKHQRSKSAESNAATSSQKVNEPDKDWDVQVSFAVEECAFCCTTDQKDELALTTVELQHVYHVPGMKKNLLSVSQLTASSNFVLFELDEVKVYQNKKITGTPIMQGKRMETVYVMSAQEAYVDKVRKNETVDL
ncbi:hypothetical protein ACH5RR_028330 [Cinchona calisaya]|uniref:Uncharacterized protein n=1 Tax=Cinchona calisaya TaxID=153742 RepID=A0ABD2YS85_9GENT